MAETLINSRAPLVLLRVLNPEEVLHRSTRKYATTLAKRLQLASQPTPQDTPTAVGASNANELMRNGPGSWIGCSEQIVCASWPFDEMTSTQNGLSRKRLGKLPKKKPASKHRELRRGNWLRRTDGTAIP